jgi:hypothetical protein
MDNITVQEQIEIIKRATHKALRSKKAARKFLADAGIILRDMKPKKAAKKKK